MTSSSTAGQGTPGTGGTPGTPGKPGTTSTSSSTATPGAPGKPGQPDRAHEGIRKGEEHPDAAPSPLEPGSPGYYQRAGQARQIANELENLVGHGGGESQRADKLRKNLKHLGVDPDAAEKADKDTPEGRSTRPGNRITTDAPGASKQASGGLAPGVSVPPAGSPSGPASSATVGSATVTTKTEVSTKPADKK